MALRMKRFLITLGTVLGLAVLPAQAAVYDFDVSYFGSGLAVLDPGSDDPVGLNIQVGDSFNWNIHAAGAADFWRVTSGGSLFPFMAFLIPDAGIRTGTFSLNLYLDGSLVLTHAEQNVDQRFNHMGTNHVMVGTGLEFDEMELIYALTASNVAINAPASPLTFLGTPEEYFSSNIEFVQQQVVPEPGSLALLAAGLMMALVTLRRRR